MKAKPEISVIVPAYNAEGYLRGCVDSVLGQSFSDFELIIVDDGSKDATAQMCDELASSDERIIVAHKQNGGVSSARNMGLEMARGEYISFLDADDSFTATALEVLLKLMKSEPCDMVTASYIMDKTMGRKKAFIYPDERYDEDRIISELFVLFRTLHNAPWGKLFRADIIKLYDIRFPLDIPYGEDSIFCLEYYKHIENSLVSSEIVYNYNWTNPQSAMRKFMPRIYDYYLAVLEAKRAFYVEKNRPDIFEQQKKDEIEWYFSVCLEHYITHVYEKDKLCEYIKNAAEAFSYAQTMEGCLWFDCVRNADYRALVKAWIKSHRYTYWNYYIRNHFLSKLDLGI